MAASSQSVSARPRLVSSVLLTDASPSSSCRRTSRSSRTSSSLRGGQVLGMGKYGCVVTPSLEAEILVPEDDASSASASSSSLRVRVPSDSRTVSKIFLEGDHQRGSFRSEARGEAIIFNLDPNSLFSAHGPKHPSLRDADGVLREERVVGPMSKSDFYTCIPRADSSFVRDQATGLITRPDPMLTLPMERMPAGSTDLHTAVAQLAASPDLGRLERFMKLFFGKLCFGLALMEGRVNHLDLHWSNVLVNLDANDIRLIDFGFMQNTEDLPERGLDFVRWWYMPLEAPFFGNGAVTNLVPLNDEAERAFEAEVAANRAARAAAAAATTVPPAAPRRSGSFSSETPLSSFARRGSQVRSAFQRETLPSTERRTSAVRVASSPPPPPPSSSLSASGAPWGDLFFRGGTVTTETSRPLTVNDIVVEWRLSEFLRTQDVTVLMEVVSHWMDMDTNLVNDATDGYQKTPYSTMRRDHPSVFGAMVGSNAEFFFFLLGALEEMQTTAHRATMAMARDSTLVREAFARVFGELDPSLTPTVRLVEDDFKNFFYRRLDLFMLMVSGCMVDFGERTFAEMHGFGSYESMRYAQLANGFRRLARLACHPNLFLRPRPADLYRAGLRLLEELRLVDLSDDEVVEQLVVDDDTILPVLREFVPDEQVRVAEAREVPRAARRAYDDDQVFFVLRDWNRKALQPSRLPEALRDLEHEAAVFCRNGGDWPRPLVFGGHGHDDSADGGGADAVDTSAAASSLSDERATPMLPAAMSASASTSASASASRSEGFTNSAGATLRTSMTTATTTPSTTTPSSASRTSSAPVLAPTAA